MWLGMWRRGVGRGGGSSSRLLRGLGEVVVLALSGDKGSWRLCEWSVCEEKRGWRWGCEGVVALLV